MSAPLPQGIVTFLMTDVEESMAAWEAREATMLEASRAHDTWAEELILSYNGHLLKKKGEGDALFVVFDDPVAAVRCAVAIQRKFQFANWPGNHPLKVRMALHVGHPSDFRDDDYFGPVVNRCARIKGAGHGEQILISNEVYERTAAVLGNECQFLDLGKHKLKSLEFPIQLYQVSAEGIRSDFPPVRSLNPVLGKLPKENSEFIGREADVAQISGELLKRQVVSIIGFGGLGKTRLATELGHQLQAHFPDGTWMIELDRVQSPQMICSFISETLGTKESTSDADSGLRSLVDSLKDKRCLLILDNCEHVLHEITEIIDALTDEPTLAGVRILATSRERIHSKGIYQHKLAPLKVPEAKDQDQQSWLKCESVQLFLTRASDDVSNFPTDPKTLEKVRDLCVALEGSPFMIELAAARVRSVPIEVITARIGDIFRILGKGPQGNPLRQADPMNLVQWSYNLLTPEEQRTLNRLSVLSGGFNLEAAERVAGYQPLDSYEIIEYLTSLVDKSLVALEQETLRYRMPGIIRQFSAGQLTDAGESVRTQDQAADYFMEFSQGISGSPMAVDYEIENIRSAFMHMLATAPQFSAQLIINLFAYFQIRTRFSEPIRLLKQAIAKLKPHSDIYGRAYQTLGNLYRLQGNIEDAKSAFQVCLEYFEESKSDEGIGAAYANLATCETFLGEFNSAISLAAKCALIAERHARYDQIVTCRIITANALSGQHDHQGAERELLDAQTICNRHSLPAHLEYVVSNLGLVYAKQDRPKEAIKTFASHLRQTADREDYSLLIQTFRFAAEALIGLEDYASAASLYGLEKHLRIRQELSLSKNDEMDRMLYLSKVEFALGERFQEHLNALLQEGEDNDLWEIGVQFILDIAQKLQDQDSP